MNPYDVRISPFSVDLVNQVLSGDWIGEGPMVAEFERQLNERLGLSNPVALNSGTAALHLALIISGVGPGDEVIIPAQTFIATATAVMYCGATPVFADIDPLTGNISPVDIRRRITGRTKAIIPVHYGGLPCDMRSISAIADEFGLTVIEDAAHALGARYNGTPVGALSPFTCFSFQAIKHITAGDGGALCCTNRNAAREAVRRRWFGIDRHACAPSELGDRAYDVRELGYKYHMNDIAAAIALGNLADFQDQLKARRRNATFYRRSLSNVPGLRLLRIDDGLEPAYWLFTVLVERRLEFIRALAAHGIPATVSMLRIDKNSLFGGQRDDLPGQDEFDASQVNIPVHAALTDEDVWSIVDAIKGGWA